MDTILAGERRPKVLADLCDHRMTASKEAVAGAPATAAAGSLICHRRRRYSDKPEGA